MICNIVYTGILLASSIIVVYTLYHKLSYKTSHPQAAYRIIIVSNKVKVGALVATRKLAINKVSKQKFRRNKTQA